MDCQCLEGCDQRNELRGDELTKHACDGITFKIARV